MTKPRLDLVPDKDLIAEVLRRQLTVGSLVLNKPITVERVTCSTGKYGFTYLGAIK